MEAGGRGTASGCRHAIDATGERDYLVDVRQEGVLMQRISEYSAPGMGLPPHAALYPHIYGATQSRRPLTPPPTPTLPICQKLTILDAGSVESMEYTARSSPDCSDACRRRQSIDYLKTFTAIRPRLDSRRLRGVCKSRARICVRRTDGALPVLADEFLLKEVDRAMAIFVTRKKTEGQSLTIKEVRNKANQMVTVLRGKKTLYRVGRKWARVFLKRPDNAPSQGSFCENRVSLTQNQQRLHWKKVNVGRYLLDYADASQTRGCYGEVPRHHPTLWWQAMDTRFNGPELSTRSISS
ncbi:uncharacterized protein LOC111266706 isoform X2 [Varroa jacobsoni]|uniref:Uncharacterized protein n=1 Tax=Varroa destructor TaxID=109461 RepID=A0A7M7KD83_VARDE|nr:uncharacterized protein LOC111251521 isoform X2 [Varroa destructor]XP_022700161.1 uncharacterized protein LOC111266706 isoform X2 [Varroa jacobsoni]